MDFSPSLCVELCRCPAFLPLVWRYVESSRQAVLANGVSAVELLCVCLSQARSISVQCAECVDSGDGMMRLVKAVAVSEQTQRTANNKQTRRAEMT